MLRELSLFLCLTALCRPQFVTLTGFADCVMEYNQEQLRVKALDGGTSLVRSFPSRVAVRRRSRLELCRVGPSLRSGFARSATFWCGARCRRYKGSSTARWTPPRFPGEARSFQSPS